MNIDRKIGAVVMAWTLGILAVVAGFQRKHDAPGSPAVASAVAQAQSAARTPQVGALVHAYDGAQSLVGPGVFAYNRGVLTLEMTPRSTAGIYRNGFERARP